MPIYVFECKKHGIFEVYQEINDKHVAVCDKCGEDGMRVFTPSQLKCQDSPYAKNWNELQDNLGKDGKADKDWRRLYDGEKP